MKIILRALGKNPYVTQANDDREHGKALEETGFWGKKAAGCVFYAKDTGRFMIAHRSKHVQEPSTWGTWGGAIDKGETPEQGVTREVAEESGYTGGFKLKPLYVFRHSSGFEYHNFLAIVPHEFVPKLDWENSGYAWVDQTNWPRPLHPGMPPVIAAIAKLKL